jgi:hydroxyacylglutathione hydrolase
MLKLQREGLRIFAFKLGKLFTNCYVVEYNGLGLLIDPVVDAKLIAEFLRQNEISIDFCLATHCHFDHVGAAAELIEMKVIDKLYCNQGELIELRRSNIYSKLIAKMPFQQPGNVEIFDSNLLRKLSERGIEVISTPGHTAGHSVFHFPAQNLLFSGDLILHHSADKPFVSPLEDRVEVAESIKRVAEQCPPDMLIFPGHGEMTMFEAEMVANPTIQLAKKEWLRTSLLNSQDSENM